MRSLKLKNITFVPGMLLILVVISGGFIKSLMISLGFYKEIGLNSFTLAYYKAIFTQAKFLNSLFFTLSYATISAVLAVIVGVLLSIGLYESGKLSKFINSVPIIIPHMIAVAIFLNLFAQSGFFARLVFHLGLISEPAEFLDIFYKKNAIGINLVYLFKGAPFVASVLLSILLKIPQNEIHAAMNLGATYNQTFRYIIFPRIKYTLIKCFLILFSFALGDYTVAFLIGPSSPKALAVKSYLDFVQRDFMYKPYSFAINTLLTLIGLIVVFILVYLEAKSGGQNEKNL